jgi:hypothetical protein
MAQKSVEEGNDDSTATAHQPSSLPKKKLGTSASPLMGGPVEGTKHPFYDGGGMRRVQSAASILEQRRASPPSNKK